MTVPATLAAAGAGGAVLFAANLSMLWAELPLAERFERAARAGFGAVELWWPGDADAESLPGLTARWNLRLALLNFDAGDMAAGFIADVARPNVRLQFDVYHVQRMEGDLVASMDAHWGLISHIQIADVPGRNEPGTGEINYPFILGHIDDKGYQGAVGLEYRPSTGRAEDSFGWLEDYRRTRGHRP